MTRLRYNNESGVLGVALSAVANGTSQVVTGFFASPPDFLTITGSDYIAVALDSGKGTYELGYITAYTAGSLNVTITRGAEDATNWPAVGHLIGSAWAVVPTVQDFVNASSGVTSISSPDSSITIGNPTTTPTLELTPLTGDVTTFGSAATLIPTGPGVMSGVGSATTSPVISIDAKGRVTALSSVAITGGGSSGGRTGEIVMWPTATPPLYGLLCNGQAVSRATYLALFTTIGTTFGTGDGSTTFNVPDYRSVSPVGAGTGVHTGTTAYTVGTYYGVTANAVTLSTANIPVHAHTYSGSTGGHSHTYTGSTGTESAPHTHNFPVTTFTTAASSAYYVTVGTSAGFLNYEFQNITSPLTSSETPSHSHTFSGTTSVATDTYSGTTSSIGSGTALSIPTQPPSLAINFVICFE